MKSILVLLMSLLLAGSVTAQEEQYFMSKSVSGDIESVTKQIKTVIKDYQFGVVTEINMHKSFKDKLDVDIQPYRILGICNVKYAHQLYSLDDNIGVLLPCKVLLKQIRDSKVEVVFVDPLKVIGLTNNEDVMKIGKEVKSVFQEVIKKL